MLNVEQLAKKYANKMVLSDVSFELNAGEIVALLGANGSGKTTTINAICQLIEFDHGTICFENRDIRTHRDYLAKVGAVLGGSRNINWRLTAKQNAEYFAALRGHAGKQLKQNISLLERRLGLDRYSKQAVLKLSTGNKQKAALLSALAYSPQLLLLDEPTLGLDLETVAELQQIISEQAGQAEQAYLITSHDMSFIDKICQKVVVIDQGLVVFSGTVAELKKALYSYKLVVSFSALNRQLVGQQVQALCTGHYQYAMDDSNLTIEYEFADQILPFLSWLHTDKLAPANLTVTPLQMEDAYRSLTARSQNS